MCLPNDVENLTLDQIYILAIEEKTLEQLGGVRIVTPTDLVREGKLTTTSGGSYVQRLRATLRAEKENEQRRTRKARRRALRQQAIDYKLQETAKARCDGTEISNRIH